MNEFQTTRDVLSALTPQERDVLRRRFGMDEAEINKSYDSATPPPSSDDDGSGGSAPAAPQVI